MLAVCAAIGVAILIATSRVEKKVKAARAHGHRIATHMWSQQAAE